MARLLIVGGGLFGSLAATYARAKGCPSLVFDPCLKGAASPAAAGLFQESWTGKKLREHFHYGLPLLDRLYGIREVCLARADGVAEKLLFVPPAAVLEPEPIRQSVTAVGDGWLEADGRRHEGWIYIAAGIWCGQFVPGLTVHGKAGAALVFPGERMGCIQQLGPGRQALAFSRDPGTTYFSDGTAEKHYTEDHERQTVARAAAMGLTDPIWRLWGQRPYTPGGPVFRRLGNRTWIGTGGRKLGTLLAASFARRLIEEELRL